MTRRAAPLVLSAIGLCPILVAAPASAQVIAVEDVAGRRGGYSLVILGDGYQRDELPAFKDHVNALVQELLGTAPFKENANALYIRRIDVASTHSGADDPTACNEGTGAMPETHFHARFCADGRTSRLLRVDEGKVIQALNEHTKGWHTSIVVVNSTIYGGSGGDPAVASLGGRWPKTAIHELGHSAFRLADEYESWSGCQGAGVAKYQGEPEEPNVTAITASGQIKWKALIARHTPIPTTTNADCSICDPQPEPNPQGRVGLYEGALYRHCGAYRPAFNCTMRSLDHPFCPVCAKQMTKDLRSYAH
jgi:hypothetical protein